MFFRSHSCKEIECRAKEVDTQNPVRPASVRGHLRFWWRATAGAKYKTAKELHKAESCIWGSTEQQGKVRLEVENTPCKDFSPITRAGKGFSFGNNPAYALFPFQGDRETDPAKALQNVEFKVILSFAPNEQIKKN